MLTWQIQPFEHFTILTFAIEAHDGVLDHRELPGIALPPGTRGLESKGLVLSGRGPIWLYGHLMHLAHTFAWLAIFDPRLKGAVVVSRHVPSGPSVGEVVPIPPI